MSDILMSTGILCDSTVNIKVMNVTRKKRENYLFGTVKIKNFSNIIKPRFLN
jgi:hypothetical protein